MNPLRMLIVLSLMVCGVSCSKEPEPPPVVKATPPPRPKPSPSDENASPSPKIVQKTAPTPPPKPTPVRHLAPDGIFYLVTRVAQTTDSGIIGYPPGTQVILISQEAAESKVKTAEGTVITVATNLLTNDLDVAARILKTDLQSQTAAAAAVQRASEEAIKAENKSWEGLGRNKSATPTPANH